MTNKIISRGLPSGNKFLYGTFKLGSFIQRLRRHTRERLPCKMKLELVGNLEACFIRRRLDYQPLSFPETAAGNRAYIRRGSNELS